LKGIFVFVIEFDGMKINPLWMTAVDMRIFCLIFEILLNSVTTSTGTIFHLMMCEQDLCDNLSRLSLIPPGWPAKEKLTVWLNLLSSMQVN
jgi:hypothetical protein